MHQEGAESLPPDSGDDAFGSDVDCQSCQPPLRTNEKSRSCSSPAGAINQPIVMSQTAAAPRLGSQQRRNVF